MRQCAQHCETMCTTAISSIAFQVLPKLCGLHHTVLLQINRLAGLAVVLHCLLPTTWVPPLATPSALPALPPDAGETGLTRLLHQAHSVGFGNSGCCYVQHSDNLVWCRNCSS